MLQRPYGRKRLCKDQRGRMILLLENRIKKYMMRTYKQEEARPFTPTIAARSGKSRLSDLKGNGGASSEHKTLR